MSKKHFQAHAAKVESPAISLSKLDAYYNGFWNHIRRELYSGLESKIPGCITLRAAARPSTLPNRTRELMLCVSVSTTERFRQALKDPDSNLMDDAWPVDFQLNHSASSAAGIPYQTGKVYYRVMMDSLLHVVRQGDRWPVKGFVAFKATRSPARRKRIFNMVVDLPATVNLGVTQARTHDFPLEARWRMETLYRNQHEKVNQEAQPVL